MEIYEHHAQSILSAQRTGPLTRGPFPFTHSLNAFTGCQFGATTCGLFCSAPFVKNWTYRPSALHDVAWGDGVLLKVNAPDILADTLARSRPAFRQRMRILMSPTTDPYQPVEQERGLTRRLLDVFAQYDDLDLLVIHTRSPLVLRDLDLLQRIPYAWLSLTIESDDDQRFRDLAGGPLPSRRLAVAARAVQEGVKTQITISPYLTASPAFVERLLATGVQRFVVESMHSGDGARGARTAATAWPVYDPAWHDEEPARMLLAQLEECGVTVGWGTEGFCGIPYRSEHAAAHGTARTAATQRAQVRAAQAHTLPDAHPDDLTVTLGRRGEPPRVLRGFSYFWLKYISDFNPAIHCAGCLSGSYHDLGAPIILPARHILDAQRAPVFYLCGVSETQWADNLHIPFVFAPGEEVVTSTYHGVAIHIANARRLAIPWIEDGWQDFPRSYTTCRNWQFGVAHFGYNGSTRPAQGEFRTPQHQRTPEYLIRRTRRRITRD
ncbi:MAG: hypothetical protein EI684_21445 [Candidatus Viridilinea halotolerans]|uniref:Radical SAM protein n=1 Tax=Candidatus Viridilinea halotolerans TaxID=2491704 RepID=A0A426TRE3_9CHLR|nr:MAG: hypothetical protein EI684_21445 [Candidatus Viridilinea halotolerans]